MNVADNVVFGIVALVVAGLLAHFISNQFAPEARERRRCRRNHRKVISRAKRPVVMLSAKVPKS